MASDVLRNPHVSTPIDRHRRALYCAFLRRAIREFEVCIEMVERSHDINAASSRMGPGMAAVMDAAQARFGASDGVKVEEIK